MQTRNVYVISASVEKLPRLSKHIDRSNDFCCRVQFAQETNQPRICCTFEQRIRDGGDQHLGLIQTSMDKRFPVRNITINYWHVTLEKAVACHGAEVNHRHLGDQFRVTTLKLFQQRAGGPEKTDKNNAGVVILGSGAGCTGTSGHVVEITKTKLFQPWNQLPRQTVGLRDTEGRNNRKQSEC